MYLKLNFLKKKKSKKNGQWVKKNKKIASYLLQLPVSAKIFVRICGQQWYFYSLYILRLAFGSTTKKSSEKYPCCPQTRKILFRPQKRK
jgi:hypothetical protein